MDLNRQISKIYIAIYLQIMHNEWKLYAYINTNKQIDEALNHVIS